MTRAVNPPVGCQKPHPTLPFIVITQPESWYSFYHPTESRRLSRPRHCSKGVQRVPKAIYRSGFRKKMQLPMVYSNLGPLTPQSGTLPLDHCDLTSADRRFHIIQSILLPMWLIATQMIIVWHPFHCLLQEQWNNSFKQLEWNLLPAKCLSRCQTNSTELLWKWKIRVMIHISSVENDK